MKTPAAASSDAKRLRIGGRSLAASRSGSHDEGQLLLLRRLRQNLLYLKLRSLLPPNLRQPSEIQPDISEIPQTDASDDNESVDLPTELVESTARSGDVGAGDDGDETKHIKDVFRPSIKLRKSGGTLLISLVVLKKVALASRLFALLEKEKLDIVFQHQYCTETKACYTVQVRVPVQVDVEALKEEIGAWADGEVKN